MLYELRDRPAAASLHVTLEAGEELLVERRSIDAISAGLRVQTLLGGGPVTALERRLRGGSARLCRLVATRGGQTVALRRAPPCDIEHVALDGELILDRATWLAATAGVKLSTERAGAGRVLAGGALVRLRCRGTCDLWFRSPDPIHRVDLDGTWCLDGAHLLAYDATLTPTVHVLGGMRSLLLSGEGRVVELRGRGRLWFRSRIGPR